MTDTVSSRVVKSRAKWAAVIEAQERSGASAARFCREQDICYNQFLYRRKTLKVASRDTALAAARPAPPEFDDRDCPSPSISKGEGREGSQKSNQSSAIPQGDYCVEQPPFEVAMERSSRGVPVSGGFLPIHVNESAGVRLRFPMGLILESDRVPSAAWVAEVARLWVNREDSPC